MQIVRPTTADTKELNERGSSWSAKSLDAPPSSARRCERRGDKIEGEQRERERKREVPVWSRSCLIFIAKFPFIGPLVTVLVNDCR